MADVKLITVERNSKLKREDVRRAVTEAFKDYKKFKPKQTKDNGQKAA